MVGQQLCWLRGKASTDCLSLLIERGANVKAADTVREIGCLASRTGSGRVSCSFANVQLILA